MADEHTDSANLGERRIKSEGESLYHLRTGRVSKASRYQVQQLHVRKHRQEMQAKFEKMEALGR